MASIREIERRDGGTTYQVLYRLGGRGSRQSSTPLADRKSAEQLVALMNQVGVARALAIHGLSIDPVRRSTTGVLTVEQYLRRHIDHLTGVEQYTIDKYESHLRLHITPMLGHIPLTALAEEDIASWVKHLETAKSDKTGRVLSPKSIKNLHGFLSGALAKAVPKLIPANPAAGRALPRKTGDEDDGEIDVAMRMLSREEFDRLLEATTEPWRPLVEFMVASGARWGEVAAFKPGDVDRKAGVVRVRRAWKYSSKGYHIGPPKTKRSKRPINMPAAILDKLDYSNEWLFTNRTGGPVRYAGFRRRVWDKAVARAKLDPAPTPHDLRHTCASWMLNAGVPVPVVSRHLGHESIKVTVDIYGDIDRASARSAADVMAKLLT